MYLFKSNKLLFLIASIIIILITPVYTTLGIDGYKGYNILKDKYTWINRDLYNVIYEESRFNHISFIFIAAIIDAESRGNRLAVSRSGAMGFMQIMPFHLPGKKDELFDTRVNIRLGTRIFKYYLKMANGDIFLALKYYERGPKGTGYNIGYASRIFSNVYRMNDPETIGVFL